MQEVSSLTKRKGNGAGKANRADKGGISISLRSFMGICTIYLTLPVIIFFLGWIKTPVALPASALMILCAVLFVREVTRKPEGGYLDNSLQNGTSFRFDIRYLVIIVIAALAITVISNIGEYVWGSTDHAYRRAIFRDLTDYEWPVYYDLTKQSDPVINGYLKDTTVAFSYYFTYWMVPAAAGKVLGFSIGNIILVIWSALGISLTFMGMSWALRRQTYAAVVAMLIFSGLDMIPYFYYEFIGTKQDWMWLEGYTQHIVYISNINNLLNVFNQCIPCWLITVMFMMTRNGRGAGFLGALMFPYSPWATIGLVPIALWALLRKESRTGTVSGYLKNIFTLANILPPFIVLFIYAPMYMANSNATSVSGSTLGFYGSIGKLLTGYLAVILIEIVPASILLWKDWRKNTLFYVVIATLLVMPFYKISYQNDFTMRGAMPEFFVLTVMLAGTVSRVVLKETSRKTRPLKDTLKLIGGAVLLLAMAFVCFQQLLITFVSTFDGSRRFNEDIYSFGDMRNPDYHYYEIVDEQFFVYDYEDTFFYKYLARR